MSGKVKGILAVIVLMGIGLGARWMIYDDSAVQESSLSEEEAEKKKKINAVYNTENQAEIKEDLERLKQEQTYTQDNMLIKYNPFGTNTQSLYVYFETENPAQISYTIHVADSSIEDFKRTCYQESEMQTQHELQVIGLIPDLENEITFTIAYEDGTVEEKTVSYEMGSLLGTEKVQLSQEDGESQEALEDGLYVVLGNDSEALDFMYYYDNNGVLRGEVPILGYRSHRLLFEDDKMYYSISESKMAQVDRLGQVTNVYDLGQYKLHHDYVFDDNGDLLILASDSKGDSVEDMVIKLNISTGDVEKVLDLGELFPDYKASCVENTDGELDWMHINTIQWLGDEEVILSSRETSTILKITDLYEEPKVDYMIGVEDFWKDTAYAELLLEKNGEFVSQGGQHAVTYVEDAGLPDGQYYLYMFNNNIGVSQSRPEYDWAEAIENVQSKPYEGTTSMYYKYLVDENAGTYELVDSFDVPYSGYVSSVQDMEHNTVVDSGFAGIFGEYDEEHQLIRQFTMEKEKVLPRISFPLDVCETKLTREFPKKPFVPQDEKERALRCEEILTIQAMGLKKRLLHTHANTAVVGISGGLDSTLALIVTAKAFDMIGKDKKEILAITMPCFGTTDRTYRNACKMAEQLGATLREVKIADSVSLHFQDIGHDPKDHSVTYENAQARERTQVLMDIANATNGMVIGTGDMSELALGWATYNGDHMSMYGVNASVPKTLVRHLVKYAADVTEDPKLQEVLYDVLDTPVSPELLPPKDGDIAQKTEDLVGPYELHDFYLYFMLRFGYEPGKIYRLAVQTFEGVYEKETILKWLTTFCRRFFNQQFKRSCLPDGPKIGTVALSPRGDWRMPSDACAQVWMRDLEKISL